MDGAVVIGFIIGLIIGLAVGGVIGGLLIMLGAKIVMGSSAKFGRAFWAAIASGAAGFALGFVIGLILGAVAPGMAGAAQIMAFAAGFLITPAIYSAIVRTNDGRAPSYVQGLLIYLVQLAVVVPLIALMVFALHVQIPGLPSF